MRIASYEVRCQYCGQKFAKQTDLSDHLSGGGCDAAIKAFQKRNEAEEIENIIEDRLRAQEERAFRFLRE